MKKKLGIILAILLCAVLVFTLVACGNKDNNGTNTNDPAGSGDPQSSGGSSLKGVDDAQVTAVETKLQAYLDSWASAHATEELEDQKGLLKSSLTTDKAQFKLTGDKSYTPSFDVKYASGKYTVTVSWDQGAKTVVKTVNAMTVTYSHWAGLNSRTSEYEFLDGKGDMEETLDVISNALVNTVNKVTGNVVTGKFGLDGTLGFDAFGKSYGLRVKGNVDITDASKTEIGLVIVNTATNKDIAGIYYKGAANAKDSRLYFQLLTKGEDGQEAYTYKYLEYADILGFLDGLLEGEEANNGAFANATGDFDGLLSFFGVPDSTASMVPGIVEMLAKAYKSEEADGDRYLIDINLADVLGQVSGIMSTLKVNLSFLDEIGIDLSTMHGLFGHISIGVKVTGDEDAYELSDVELAVNIPEESVFYFTDDETDPAKRLDPPSIGFAIYAKDFSFLTTGTVANVVPAEAIRNAESGKGYFSPTNLDMSGDVYVNHSEGEQQGIDSTFHFEFVTDINPLEIIANGYDSEAKAALVIKQHSGKVTYAAADAAAWSNFLSISYEQKSKLLCVSGTAFGLDDNGETVYKLELKDDVLDGEGKVVEAGTLKKIEDWLGLTNYIGLNYSKEKGIYLDPDKGEAKESAQVIFGNKLVQELMIYLVGGEKKAEDDAAIGEGAAAGLMDEIGDYVDGVKAIYNTLVEGGVIAFNADPFSLSINVTPETISTVINAINSTFGLEIEADDISALKDLGLVKIEANSEGYTDKVYIEVKYGTNTYKLTFDGSQENKFVITFTMTLKSNRTYSVIFDATSGDAQKSWTASVLVDIKDGEGKSVNSTEVTLSNFHAEWGNNNSDEVKALIPTDAQKAAASEIFPKDGTGPATQLAKGILKVLSSDKVYDYALSAGKFIIRQVKSFMA